MDKFIIEKTIKKIQGRSIFLIGMMGCGKSQTGPILARLLSYKYIDLDTLIERLANKTINQIFIDSGEEEFRELETNCLKETIKIPSLVISTGGGIVTTPQNWGILRQGIVIWLDVDKNIVIERLKDDLENRPLLQEGNLNNLYTNILKSRKNLYSQADLRIEVNNENLEEVSEKIIYAIHEKTNN